MKKIIGIVSPAKLYEDEIPHRDLFLFGNPYIRRIEKHGAIPIGILPADGYANEEALALCDGFLLAGGNKIWPYHLQVIEHAWKAGKPLLGICLGMQAISAFFHVRERARTLENDTLVQFEKMKKDRYMFTYPVKDHYLENVTRQSSERSKHSIEIAAGSRLFEAMGRTSAEAVSLHSYRIAPVADGLRISAVASDGTIEGIEHNGHIVGVQFHPEVEDEWDVLFKAFVSGVWKAKQANSLA